MSPASPCRMTATISSGSRGQQLEQSRSRARLRVRGWSAVSTMPASMVMMGLTESRLPIAARAGLIRPPRLQVLKRFEREVQAQVALAPLELGRRSRRPTPPACQLRRQQGQQAGAHARRFAVDDADAACSGTSRAPPARSSTVADSLAPMPTYTISSAPSSNAPCECLAKGCPARRRRCVGKGAPGLVSSRQNSSAAHVDAGAILMIAEVRPAAARP